MPWHDVSEESPSECPLETPHARNLLDKIWQGLKAFHRSRTMKQRNAGISDEWEMVAVLVDRLLLFIFMTVFVLLPVALFIRPAIIASLTEHEELDGQDVYPYPPMGHE